MKIRQTTLAMVFLLLTFEIHAFEAEGEGSRYYTDSIYTILQIVITLHIDLIKLVDGEKTTHFYSDRTGRDPGWR